MAPGPARPSARTVAPSATRIVPGGVGAGYRGADGRTAFGDDSAAGHVDEMALDGGGVGVVDLCVGGADDPGVDAGTLHGLDSSRRDDADAAHRFGGGPNAHIGGNAAALEGVAHLALHGGSDGPVRADDDVAGLQGVAEDHFIVGEVGVRTLALARPEKPGVETPAALGGYVD